MSDSNYYFEVELKPEDAKPNEDLVLVAHPSGGTADERKMTLASLGALGGTVILDAYTIAQNVQYKTQYDMLQKTVNTVVPSQSQNQFNPGVYEYVEGVSVWSALTSVACSMSLSTGDETGLSFPRLAVVMGDLEMECDDYYRASGRLEYPALRYVMGDCQPYYYCEGVRAELPKLELVGGLFELTYMLDQDLLNANEPLILPELTEVGGDLTLDEVPFPEISFPKLQRIGGWTPFSGYSPESFSPLRAINLPLLREVTENFSFGGSSYGDPPNLTRAHFPSLVTVGGRFEVTDFPAVNEINAPLLKSCSAIDISGCPRVTKLHFPELEQIAGDGVYNSNITLYAGMDGLTEFRFGPNLKEIEGYVGIDGSPLDQASVDHILIAIAALDGTNGTVSFDDKSVSLNGPGAAPPSAAGLAAYTTLVTRGNTVMVNSP